MPFAGYDDFDACTRDNSDKEEPSAYCAQIHYEVTGEWPAEKFEQKFGENPTFDMPIEVAELAIKRGDIPLGTWKQINSDSLIPFRKLAQSETDPRRFKRAIDMAKISLQEGVSDAIAKADNLEKVGFDAEINRSVSMVFKQDDEFLIWGPASVEVVDKEQDKISVEALDKALPQLLKRASLSYAHTDQLVGKILERFETDEPVSVEINGETYERKSFPTSVLDLDDGNPPAMFVAGEVYDDTNQAQEVREKIESGEIDSYSISGEALVTQKQVDGSMVYDDVIEMDLSAVTLCEEGMNQGAKFARVDGDVDEKVEPETTDKSYEVASGSVSNPQEVDATMSKSDTSSNGNSGSSDFDPDQFLKREEFEGEIATKEDVNAALDETVDKTVDAVVEEVEKTIPSEEDISKRAEQAVKSRLPEGDLATMSFIDDNFARKGDYEEEEMEDDDDDEMEREDDMEGDYEEEEEEMEMEEEMERSLSREQLKEDLPGDVWSVVSEYIGDSKEKSEESSTEADELHKAVEEIIDGKQASSPSVNLGDREEELDDRFEKNEDEQEMGNSPALDKWR